MASSAAQDILEHSELKRSITAKQLYFYVVGDVLGSGIYVLVGLVAAAVGGAFWMAFLAGVAIAAITGLAYAELVTKYPQAGGAAVFAQRAYGRPWLSFLVGFAMLAAGVTSAAALSLAFAGDYLAEFADLPQTPVALVFLLLVALLNARGIRDSLRANVVMTLIELSGLVLVVVLAVAILGAGDGNPGQAVEFREGVNPGSAVLAASVLAFYSFVGFETSANVAEETRDPRRAYPRALLGGLVIAGVVYCLVGLAVSTALPLDELTSGGNPLLAVVEASPISVPTKVFAAIALVAVANGALLTMIMASRMAFGMAEQRLLPPTVGRVLPRRRTPGVAIAATTLAAYLLLITGQLESLAETTVLLLLLVFVSANVAVLVLRRDAVEHDHFRTPWPLPVLGVLSCIVLATQQDAGNYLRAGVLLAVGLALYAAARGIDRRRG